MLKIFFKPLFVLSLVLIVFSACSEDSMSASKTPTELVYVCNQGDGTISLIDGQNHEVTETLKLADYGFSFGSKPHHVVVEKDGSAWYVSLITDGKVLKFNNKNELVGTADTPTPGMMALHPTAGKLYVARSMTAPSPPSSIIAINTSTMAVTEIPLAFARPHSIAIQNSGDYLYTGSLVENKIAIINAATDEVEETLTFAGENNVFVQFSISPDDKVLYATGQISNTLLFFTIGDFGSLTLKQTIETGEQPWHPALSADGQYIYFGNKISNSVNAINTATNAKITITGNGIASPHGSALSKDGKYLFISNQNNFGDYTPKNAANASDVGTVVVISTETNKIEKIIEIGKTPSGMGL